MTVKRSRHERLHQNAEGEGSGRKGGGDTTKSRRDGNVEKATRAQGKTKQSRGRKVIGQRAKENKVERHIRWRRGSVHAHVARGTRDSSATEKEVQSTAQERRRTTDAWKALMWKVWKAYSIVSEEEGLWGCNQLQQTPKRGGLEEETTGSLMEFVRRINNNDTNTNTLTNDTHTARHESNK